MKNENRSAYRTLHAILLSEHTKEYGERIIVSVAILSFLLHLLLILLTDLQILAPGKYASLLNNPIAAIYTPFSFILIYEVYLLVYYLPRSISIYIGKQYEIITLIVVRRIFKDLANLEMTPDWFEVQNDLQFTYDIIATLVLFLLIFLFYRLNQRKEEGPENGEEISPALARFIKQKNWIAMGLVPVFLGLAIYSAGHWIYENFMSVSQIAGEIKDVNKIFFGEFFTMLILADVLLLLLSLSQTDKFNKVIRNSGFIISTILIRLSFGVTGLLNTALIVVAVLFGVLVLAIHNQYEKITIPE